MKTTHTFLIGAVLGLALSIGLSAQNVGGGTIAGTSMAITGDSTITKTITAASTSTERLLYSTFTMSPTGGTLTATTGSLAAVRGEMNLASGKTLTDGFFFGAQGKFVATTGTLNQTSAGRIVGLLGQADLGSMVLTSGQTSAVWADLQGTPTNNSGELYVLRVSNSMGINANSLAEFIGHATYALSVNDLGNGSSGDFVVNASGTGAGQCAQMGGLVATKTLKIRADGVDYWLPLCTAP